MTAALAPSTIVGYNRKFKLYEEFCRVSKKNPKDLSDDILCAFVLHLF
jgi:hypothetical protein